LAKSQQQLNEKPETRASEDFEKLRDSNERPKLMKESQL
jgi:hypothetical protein